MRKKSSGYLRKLKRAWMRFRVRCIEPAKQRFGDARARFIASAPQRRRTRRRIRDSLKRGVRTAARAVWSFYARLAALPTRTLLIGGGGVGLLLLVTIVLAIAIPSPAGRAVSAQITPSPVMELNASETPGQGDATADVGTDMPATTPAPDGAEATQTLATCAPETSIQFCSGDDDPEIAEIQNRLMELGYMDSDEATEHCGPLTYDAVKCFQMHNDLGRDGIVGGETYTLLMSSSAKEYVMQQGDEGEDVEGVQQRLYELGYLSQGSQITGTFGEHTAAAVKLFQEKNSLKADGKVGSKTLEMLYDEDVVSNSFIYGDESDEILKYQKRLKVLGYITFDPDGVFGSKTIAAVREFQERNGLVRDGAIGPATRDLLMSDDAQAYVIALGDSGTEVKNIQRKLAKLNYLSTSDVDGYFGELTQLAVKAFQKRNSLTTDGAVGAKTLAKLNSDSAREAAAATTLKPTATPSKTSSGTKATATPGKTSSSSSSSSGVEKLISIAETKIGCKYVRGAKGPNSFDCSGFVYWCLNQAGVKQGYMTSIAWRSCSKYQRITDMDDIKRGDILVFVGSSSAMGHVGIYLGSGKMIDAGSSVGKVRITTTVLRTGGYWPSHFLMAYRIF